MNANSCYKNMVILGNPYSPHISVWLNALTRVDAKIDKTAIYHGASGLLPENGFRILFSKSIFRFFPKNLMYFLGGLVVFIKYLFKSNSVVHAHCASGYGLMAFLSQKKYAVTTYGSEIFDKDQKSFVYHIMMSMILKHACLISASSRAMEDYLVDQYSVERSKIRTFSLGVSEEFLKPTVPGKLPKDLVLFLDRNEFVFFSNRRITPHYNIDYIVREFETFLTLDPSLSQRCGLLLLSGDYHVESLEKITQYIDSHHLRNNIMVITDYLDRNMMASILEKTTATISMAKTDQLSAAILESVSKNVPPILNRLDAYEDIFEHQCGIFLDTMDKGLLAASLNDTIHRKFDPAIYDKMKTYVSSFLEEKTVQDKIVRFYQELMGKDIDRTQ